MNGKTFWLHKNEQFAIWYLPKGLSNRGNHWLIGHTEELGKAFGFIASPDDVTEPQEATTWEYSDGTVWKSSNPGDVMVSNIPNSGSTFHWSKKSVIMGMFLLLVSIKNM